MTNKQLARGTARTLEVVAVVGLLLWPADWMVWRGRVAAGGGMGQVEVSNMTAAELKGNKEEFYVDGTSALPCSESLFRQAGSGACWYLRRHAQVVTRY